ncbi:MAG: hypothetical protein HZA00_04875 [Nitrospinae bacterium]|nr:hypothetical protein [Nitrospinota bacterium]
MTKIHKIILIACSIYFSSTLSSCTTVKTVAGTGVAGCVDGAGLASTFNDPSGVVTDPWQNIYVADSGCNKIRQVVHGPNNVTSYAGTGTAGCADGNVLTTATFRSPVDVARDTAGNYYVADQQNHVIRKIDQGSGIVTTVAGQCGQALLPPQECQEGVKPCLVKTKVPDVVSVKVALFSSPSGVAVDNVGNIYVADYGTCSVRKIDTKGVVTTVGKKDGEKVPAYATCCGQCTGPFSYPTGIDVDAAGNIYVVEYWGHKISKIAAATENITVLAGSNWGYKDGPGNQAAFMHPYHLVLDQATGDIYVADLGNNRIRKIANDAAHTVSTLAGDGVLGFKDCTSIGSSVKCAEFNHPRGIEFVKKLLLYIGDTGNNRIREIDP